LIQLGEIIRLLRDNAVDFVVVGGTAGNAHGSARVTYDLDLVYRRSPENLERLVRALQSHNPYLRGAPPGLPFRFDVATLRRGLNFTLTTKLGDLDLLGEIAGGGNYESLEPQSRELEAFGVRFRCVTLEQLIRLKRAAGRPKDLEAIAELEALLDERQRQGAS
jgi:predicted nucleotidyltransferase